MVDVLLLVFVQLHFYHRGGWNQIFPLKTFVSCSLGVGGRCLSVPWRYPDVWVPDVPKISCPNTLSLGCFLLSEIKKFLTHQVLKAATAGEGEEDKRGDQEEEDQHNELH